MNVHAQKLHDAIKARDLELVRSLIAAPEGGPSIFAYQDSQHNGVFHWAVPGPSMLRKEESHGNLTGGSVEPSEDGAMMTLLLSVPDRPKQALERMNKQNRTPLTLASLRDEPQSAKWLLEAGADPNRQYQCMGTGPSALHEAHSAAMVRRLVQHHAKLDLRDTLMKTPLLKMAMHGHLDAFDALLEAGADLNAVVVNNPQRAVLGVNTPQLGYNALQVVIDSSLTSPAMVTRLLDLGFSPTLTAPDGSTALSLALERSKSPSPNVALCASASLTILENWVLRQTLDASRTSVPPLPKVSRVRL